MASPPVGVELRIGGGVHRAGAAPEGEPDRDENGGVRGLAGDAFEDGNVRLEIKAEMTRVRTGGGDEYEELGAEDGSD